MLCVYFMLLTYTFLRSVTTIMVTICCMFCIINNDWSPAKWRISLWAKVKTALAPHPCSSVTQIDACQRHGGVIGKLIALICQMSLIVVSSESGDFLSGVCCEFGIHTK